MSETRISELLAPAQRGGRRELQAFLEEVRPVVCRWALMWTGSPDAAEDIAQKVLVKVYRSISQYRGGRVEAWIYRMCRNAFLDWERQRGRQRRFRDRLSLIRLVGEAERHEVVSTSVGRDLIELMSELSPRQRAVIDLVDLQGFAPSEVADMLNLAPQTVRVHLHRARSFLRSKHQGRVEYDDAEETISG